ncbi:MAG: sulfatase-like hydrolase/transferase [Candidatus Alcyoniella australis]|nr:sulfatase-like hydrolase/transferase [Candidatus Alcyoniella australis]
MLSKTVKRLEDPRTARIAALLIIALSILPRLINLDAPIWDAHSWNQCSAATVARNLWISDLDWLHPEWDVLNAGSARPHVEAEEAPIYHLLLAAGYGLLGRESLGWARLVTILLSLPGALWLFALMRRELGARAAVFGLLFYCFSPLILFFNRAVASDGAMVAFGIGAVYYFRRYSEDGGAACWLASLCCLVLSGLFKPFGLLVGVPIMAISLGRWGARAALRPTLWLYALVGLAIPLSWIGYAASIGSLGRGGPEKGLFSNTRLWGEPGLLLSPRFWNIVQSWIFDRGLTPPATVLALFALLQKNLRPRLRLFLWWALGCLLYVMIVRNGNQEHVYYSMPWLPPLSALAGAGMAALLDWRPQSTLWQRPARHRMLLAGLLLLAFAGWSASYTYNFFRADRSSVIAGHAADRYLPPGALIVAWDPGSTRKTQLIYHAQRRGWHVGSLSPERIKTFQQLGAQAVVVCLSDEQATQPKRAQALEYLERNYELLWSKRGELGKRGEPHFLAIYALPQQPSSELPLHRFARELQPRNVSGPWTNLLPFPDVERSAELLDGEQLRFALAKQVARGRLIHFLESRESLLIAPGVEYSFPLTVPEQARLTFSATARPELLDAFKGRLTIEVWLEQPQGGREALGKLELRRRPLLEQTWKLRESWQLAYQHINFWRDADLDLSPWAGRSGKLVFTCSAAGIGEPGDLQRQRERTGTDAPFAAALSEPTLWVHQTLDRRPPDLLVILIDGIRPDALSCYGYGRQTTPQIDALAQRGALFQRAYAPSNYTRGSTSALFTGFHPGLHGVPLGRWSLSPLEKFAFRRVARRGLTQRLRDAGYSAIQVGANPFLQEPVKFGADAGFDRVYSFNLRRNDTAAITKIGRRMLRQNRDRPLLLYLHYNNGHGPYQAPHRFQGRFDAAIDNDPRTWPAGYDEELAYADQAVGRILAELERLGLSEQTLIVITADHGRGWDQGHPQGHGQSLYSGEVRVPLVISGPGVEPGVRYGSMVSLLDLAPTIAELAHVPADPDWPGVSLAPALRGDGVPLHQRIYFECGTAVGLKTQRHSVISKAMPSGSPFKGKPADDGLFLELYDDLSDPQQLDNLANDGSRITGELAGELFAHKRKLDNQRWALARTLLDLDPRVIGDRSVSDGIYAESFEGSYRLLLLPDQDNQATHVVSGSLRCNPEGLGWIDMAFPDPFGASISISEDRKRLDFIVELGAEQRTLSWRTFPEVTPIELELLLDGEPLDANRLNLGPWQIPFKSLPAKLGTQRDYSWLLSSRSPDIAGLDGPRALLWMVEHDPAKATGALGQEVEGALRQWGYVK